MSRRLVIHDDTTDSIFALDPNQAAGVPLPTFKVVASVPAAGTLIGETVYDSTTRRGFVWDGNNWRDITASAILRYANDADIHADLTQAQGSYAVSGTTGNLYVFTQSGWLKLGTQEYATVSDLLSDMPAIGTVGIAMDENSIWEFTNAGWRSMAARPFATTADIRAWNLAAPGANIGDIAVALDSDVVYTRVAGGWEPMSVFDAPEAVIRASTWALNGQIAISTDTGRKFIFNGGAWMEDPVQHFATEVDLLQATPPPGTVAFADDTGLFYGRTASGWKRANSPTVTVSATAPASPADGDIWFNPTTKTTNIRNGNVWEGISGGWPDGTQAAPGAYFRDHPTYGFYYSPGYTEIVAVADNDWVFTIPKRGQLQLRNKATNSDAPLRRDQIKYGYGGPPSSGDDGDIYIQIS